MEHATFDTLLEDRLSRSREVLASKAKEYSTGSDRMHNFRVAAQISTNPRAQPEKIAWDFACKHLVSCRDLVTSPNAEEIPAATIREKFGDAINYLILIEAMMLEHAGEAGKTIASL